MKKQSGIVQYVEHSITPFRKGNNSTVKNMPGRLPCTTIALNNMEMWTKQSSPINNAESFIQSYGVKEW